MNRLIRFRFSLLIACLLFSFFSFSQDSEEQKKGRFNIGAEGGIQITNIKSPGSLWPWGNYITNSNTGFNAGVYGEYYINNSFKLKLGASYDQRSFELYSNFPIPDTNFNYGTSYYLYQVDYGMTYLTIPVGIVYQKGNDKFKVSLQLNFYYSILLNSTQSGYEDIYVGPGEVIETGDGLILNPGHNDTIYEGSTTGLNAFQNTEYTEFNTSDIGMNFAVGLVYQPTPSFGITLAPAFGFSFGQVFTDPLLDSKWSQITKVNIGVFYTFKKKKTFGE